MIGGRRPISGRKPGDKRVRVERHHAPYFRYTGPGQMTAKAAASAPTTTLGVIRVRVKGALLGRPLANEEEIGQRLSKTKALAIFSSDAISSSAYATEEIILAFVLAGVAGAGVQLRRAGRDRDRRAARDRRVQLSPGLPRLPQRRRVVLGVEGQLRPDGVAGRRVGADDRLHAHGRGLDLVGGRADRRRRSRPSTPTGWRSAILAIGLITLGNLRGLREAGNIFAIPTYLFLGSAFLMIAVGTFRIVFQGDTGPAPTPEVDRRHDPDGEGRDDPDPAPRVRRPAPSRSPGTEAIATGVPAFKPPEARNAARTLMVMAVHPRDPVHRHHVPRHQLPHPADRGAAGRRSSPRSRATSTATAASASTCSRRSRRCCCSSPRTPRSPRSRASAAVLAEDGFIPRQFAFRGDRLAFSTGIILLGSIAARRGRRRRRLDPRADPAVRGRRVHRLHDLAGRHGPPLAPDARARAGGGG